MIQVIHKENFQKSLWKNGLGITYQIAIYPNDSDVTKNNFIWRLSQAEVQNENSFSIFPDCERKLTIIQGAGLYLNQSPLRQNQIHTFSGEENIQCSLIEQEPVLDLGLIYKKNLVQANFYFLDVHDSDIKLYLNGRTDFLYLFDGEACLIQDQILNKGNIAQVENEAFVEIKRKHQTSLRLIHIEIKY